MNAMTVRNSILQLAARTQDLGVTLLLWAYFTLGFVIGFAPLYVWVAVTRRGRLARETGYQQINHRFYRGFFWLAKTLMPGYRWRISADLLTLQGAVLVCNHISYLDPLALMSIYPRHKTIVKGGLFSIPIFGRMLDWSGYIPSDGEGRRGEILFNQMETMGAFLAAGGILFIFPEGTRSRDGRLGDFNPGAFKIARNHGVPLHVLTIKNTAQMFKPGSFSFNSRGSAIISLDLAGTIAPQAKGHTHSSREMAGLARRLMQQNEL